MEQDIFADVEQEGQVKTFLDEAPGEAQDSQPETPEEEEEAAPSQSGDSKDEPKSEEEKSASEEPLPFHKHPRWQKMLEENKELREAQEKLQETLEKSATQVNQKEEPHFVPPHLQKVFGDDYDAYQAMQYHTREEAKAIAEAIVKERLTELSSKEKEKQEMEAKLMATYEERLTELGEEIKVPLHDKDNTERNQILDICSKYGVVDKDGYPDFVKANELRLKLYPKKGLSKERKQVAENASEGDLSTSDNSPEDKAVTSDKLKHMSMDQFFR